jgi:hypothetical protein
MRRLVRATSASDPRERLARAVQRLPEPVRVALRDVARRDDLPLVAGTWRDAEGGCLVANVVRALGADSESQTTLDLRILELVPELSSRDLNRLIVAWDEAAEASRARDDRALRRLLHEALDRAPQPLPAPAPAH